MLTLLEFGSLGFYILISIVSILIMICVAGEKLSGGWATIWILATFVGLYFLGGKGNLNDLLQHIIHHPFETVVLFLVYVLIGTCWSFVEWHWFVSKEISETLEYNSRYNPKTEPIKPSIAENKTRLFTWIFYWPWTMIWKLIHKPIERLFDQIMKWTKTTYENITNRAYDKAVKQAEEEKDNQNKKLHL